MMKRFLVALVFLFSVIYGCSTTLQHEEVDIQETATEWLAKALTLWDNDTETFTDPNKAIDYLNRSIEVDPSFAPAYLNLGNAYGDLNQYQRAIEYFDRAISLKPDYTVAYNNRGWTHAAWREYEKAIEDYNRALQIDPTYLRAILNRALAYYRLDELDLACEDWKKACDLGDCRNYNLSKQRKECP